MSAAFLRRFLGVFVVLSGLPLAAACGSSGGVPAPVVQLVASVDDLTLQVGDLTEIDVRLAAAPSGEVSVTLAYAGDAGAVVVEGEQTLRFDATNWDQPQRRTVRAAGAGQGRLRFEVDGVEVLGVDVTAAEAPAEPPPAPPPPDPAPVDPGTTIRDLAARPGAEPGRVELTFTAPLDADAYVIRKSVRHLTAANVDDAEEVPHSVVPAAPGTLEKIALAGLEEGQTLQISVQAERGGVVAPFVYAVSVTVPEGVAALPSDAVPLSGPATLDQAGATYYLTGDVSASGTAFTVTRDDVTLDLNGYTVTYDGGGSGSVHGVTASSGLSGLTIRNGRIVQAGGGGSKSHGVRLSSPRDARLSHLEVDVHGADCYGFSISSAKGTLVIDRCEIACRTTVVSNRHWPGVAAMWITGSSAGMDIRHNTITASPQWGIYLHTGATPTGDVLVHHNRIVGTKALVSNGYMLGIHTPGADVFENHLDGESRGVHLENAPSNGVSVHDNFVRVQDQPNPEYPVKHWVHGIKVEETSDVHVHNNHVVGIADEDHAEVRALDVGTNGVDGVLIERNRVEAVATDATFAAIGIRFTSGEVGDTTHALIRDNVISATDVAIERGWTSRTTGLLRDNVWMRDLSLGSGHPFVFEYFDVSDSRSAEDNRVINPAGDADVLAVDDWPGAGSYESTREWTVRVVVRDAAGDAVAGADVAVEHADGTTAFAAATDADGIAEGEVAAQVVTNGPRITPLGPAAITVSKAGVGSWSGTVDVAGRTCVIVDLETGDAFTDDVAPPAPADAFARPLGASRVHVGWSAPAADAVVYLVYVDGTLAGCTPETHFVVAGLAADTAYTVEVKAVDAGGNVSPAADAGSPRTYPEDRGA